MANDHHRHGLTREVALQPGGGLDIEVVRGLVQEHDIGVFQQQLREHHPRLLTPRERVGGALKRRGLKPEPGKDLLDPVIDRVRILVFEQVVKLVVTPAGAGTLVVILGLGHLLRSLFQLVLKLENRRDSRPGHAHQRLFGTELRMLP